MDHVHEELEVQWQLWSGHTEYWHAQGSDICWLEDVERMNSSRAHAGLLLAALTFGIGGCSFAQQPASESAESVQSSPESGTPSSPESGAPPTPVSQDVVHHVPSSGKVLSSLDNQNQSGIVGSFTVKDPRLLVYLTCRGTGIITVAMSPMGSFDLPCQDDSEPVPSENDFDVSLWKEISVTVASAEGQVWSISIVDPEG